MLKEIVLPEIADNVLSGVIGSVLVAVGDQVQDEDPLVEVETDKATSQIPAEGAGKVVEIKVNAGDTVKVGEVMIVLEVAADGDAPAAAPAEVQDEPTKPAPSAKAVEVAPIQNVPEVKAEEEPLRSVDSSAPALDKNILVPAAPSVRKLARELGVNISEVKGSGPGARITKEDVKAYVKALLNRPVPVGGVSSVAQAAPLPDFSKWGEVHSESFNKIREITAQSMTTSWQTIPQVTHFDKADITALETFRKRYAKEVEKGGGRLTVTSILVKIIAEALKKFPDFNASVDMANKQTIYKEYYHVGIAVDTPNGLLVPVVKDADKKDLTQISAEIGEHAQKARDKKLSMDDMAGGNFTISNLGGIGGTAFTPIVYAPQVAILGVSRGVLEPRYVDGELQARMMMPISLSYDHRIIDGANAARFSRFICNALENPMSMFI